MTSFYDRYFDVHNAQLKLYPDTKVLTLVQLGSFYEAYATDTEGPNIQDAASILGFTVSIRNKFQELSRTNPMMMGFPVGSSEKNAAKLRESGYTVMTYLHLNDDLFTAIKSGDEDAFNKIISTSPPTMINQSNSVCDTPLSYATNYSHTNLVKQLLERGADPNKPLGRLASTGSTVLYNACIRGNLEIATLLLNHGADLQKATINVPKPINYYPSGPYSCLDAACASKNLELVWLLLTNGANIKSRFTWQVSSTLTTWTPVMHAQGSPEIVKLLLSVGAPVAVNGEFVAATKAGDMWLGRKHRDTVWENRKKAKAEKWVEEPVSKTGYCGHHNRAGQQVKVLELIEKKSKIIYEVDDLKFIVIPGKIDFMGHMTKVAEYVTDLKQHMSDAYLHNKEYRGVKYMIYMVDGDYYMASMTIPDNYLYTHNPENDLFSTTCKENDEVLITINFECNDVDDLCVSNPMGSTVWTFEKVQERIHLVIDEMMGQVERFEEMFKKRDRDCSIHVIGEMLNGVSGPLVS